MCWTGSASPVTALGVPTGPDSVCPLSGASSNPGRGAVISWSAVSTAAAYSSCKSPRFVRERLHESLV